MLNELMKPRSIYLLVILGKIQTCRVREPDWGLVCSVPWTGGGWKTVPYQGKKYPFMFSSVVGWDGAPGATGIQRLGPRCLNKATAAFQEMSGMLSCKVTLLFSVTRQLPIEGLIIFLGEECQFFPL